MKIFHPSPLTKTEKKNAKIAYFLSLIGIVGFFIQLLYFYIRYNSLDDWWCILIFWIVFIMPGYWADAMMVVVGGGNPLDGGRVAKDGRRTFGPGKTIRGFFLGPLLGAIISLGIHGILYWQWGAILHATDQFLADPNINYNFYQNSRENLIADLSLYLLGNKEANPTIFSFLLLSIRVILCAYGAAVGDLFGSWAKRRRNLERGEPFWIVDQLDFLGGCLLFAGWFVFIPFKSLVPHVLIMLIIITPTITIFANNLSYWLGKKKVPW